MQSYNANKVNYKSILIIVLDQIVFFNYQHVIQKYFHVKLAKKCMFPFNFHKLTPKTKHFKGCKNIWFLNNFRFF